MTHIIGNLDAECDMTRPFRFEDLHGEPEPKAWGPRYPNLAGVEKWRKLDKARELTKDEVRQYGAAVGEAIRKLNRPSRYADVPLHCTVQNTCGTDNTAVGEEARYQAYVDRLNAQRLAKRNADPDWLDKKIVAALEAEFAEVFAKVERDESREKAKAHATKTRRDAKGRIMRKRAA